MAATALAFLTDLGKPRHRESEAQLLDALGSVTEMVTDENRLAASAAIAAMLRSTRSAKVRSAAALALADLGGDTAAEAINSVLEREDVAPAAGTLLFALDELGAQVRLGPALNILRNGSYEARAELLILLQDGRLAQTSDQELTRAKTELQLLAAGTDSEAAEAASLALEALDSNS